MPSGKWQVVLCWTLYKTKRSAADMEKRQPVSNSARKRFFAATKTTTKGKRLHRFYFQLRLQWQSRKSHKTIESNWYERQI